jgi:hypothetical protein
VMPPREVGEVRRQWTSAYKIDPMMVRVNAVADRRPVEMWLGIGVDEIE